MPFKWGNNSVQKYIFDYGGKHTVTKYNFNNKTAWTSGNSEYDEEATPSEYFVFKVGKGGWEIHALDRSNLPSELVIPRVYKGIPVTSIRAQAFEQNKSVTRVVIPDSVTSIGEGAFYACTNLTSVIIPDSVTSIGNHAFINSDNLTRVVIPDSVTSIGYAAFGTHKNDIICCEATTKPSGWDISWNFNGMVIWGCSSITTDESFIYTLLDNDTYSIKAADKNNMPEAVVIPSTYNGKAVTAIEMLAFNDTTISKLYIHEGITSIGYSAFAGCTSLVEVHLPASLTSIGEQAFNNCTNLATVTIANNSQLASISDYAFAYCSAFTSIILPASVTTIGAYAFRNCANLTINCKASSKPSGWATTWASGVGSVVWGY